jgi:hypothetical protein
MDNSTTDQASSNRLRELWNSVGTPVKIGLLFAIIAALMALMGWVMRPNYISRSLISLFLAIAISAGTWGVVSWAITAAAMEATKDEE